MDEQELATIQEAWDVLAEWRECGLDPATVGGPDYGPGHCDDCTARWAPVWRGVPALVAEVRRLRAEVAALRRDEWADHAPIDGAYLNVVVPAWDD